MPNSDTLLTSHQVARILGISVGWLSHLVMKGRIRRHSLSLRDGHYHSLFTPDDVESARWNMKPRGRPRRTPQN